MSTQDEPVQQGSTSANDSDKVDGLVKLMTMEVASGTLSNQDVPKVLDKWLSDAGIDLEQPEIDELAERILAGQVTPES